jgi:hypothetical protein
MKFITVSSMNNMLLRILVVLLIACTSCNSGLIPCPTVRADKVRRSSPGKAFYGPKLVTASAKETKPETTKRFIRPDTRPALEKINVEEWDCPKPGMKKNNMPRALKDNIKKNRKAFEAYYKNRSVADSVASKSIQK